MTHESSDHIPTPVPPVPDELTGDAAVTVFVRPGCPFCAVLQLGLARTGLDHHLVDIWQEPTAAAWVRSVAGGNETVPTLHVAGTTPATSVALVNPSIMTLLQAVAVAAPSALPPTGPVSLATRGRRLLQGLGALLGRSSSARR